MSQVNNQTNNPDDEKKIMVQNTEPSMLYKYRWWIVLVVALLLAWYLYSKREEISYTMNNKPKYAQIGGAELNLGMPSTVNIDTEGRNLFRL
jgi:hypothetical protein